MPYGTLPGSQKAMREDDTTMELSKHQKRKLERYGKEPWESIRLNGLALYFIELRDAKKKRYKKPGHNSMTLTEREDLIQVEPKTMI